MVIPRCIASSPGDDQGKTAESRVRPPPIRPFTKYVLRENALRVDEYRVPDVQGDPAHHQASRIPGNSASCRLQFNGWNYRNYWLDFIASWAWCNWISLRKRRRDCAECRISHALGRSGRTKGSSIATYRYQI